MPPLKTVLSTTLLELAALIMLPELFSTLTLIAIGRRWFGGDISRLNVGSVGYSRRLIFGNTFASFVLLTVFLEFVLFTFLFVEQYCSEGNGAQTVKGGISTMQC